MDWEISRLWGELKRMIDRIIAIEDDSANHESRIREIEAKIRSERAKRGWQTRRLNAHAASLRELSSRLDALERAGSTDEGAAKEILDQIEGHVQRMH